MKEVDPFQMRVGGHSCQLSVDGSPRVTDFRELERFRELMG